MKLINKAVGTTFKTGTLEHIILAHDEESGTTMCLLKDFWDTAPFDRKTGNYAESSIRNDLNTRFFKVLAAEVGEENIIEHEVDLITDDGRKDYGTVNDKISLLTTAQFREFIEILDEYNPGRWWWTATALSSKTWTDCVRCVSYYGFLNYDICDYSGGVRPFYILKSSISVSDED